MWFSGDGHVRLDIARRALSGRTGEMPHGFQEDLFQRVSAVRELPHEEVLPTHQSPDRIHVNARRQDDTPAAEAFGNTLGADLRQDRAQVAVVTGDFELDEG